MEFQSWTSAVNNFVKFGEIGGLRDLSQPQLKSILTDTKGRDVSASNLRLIIEELSKVTQYLQTNRLNILLEYDFSLFTQRLQATSDDTVAIKPFKQVLGLVQKKVANLVDAKDLIWLQSAKWCLEHNLIQQSYTQLQEGLLTFFTHLLNEALSGNPLLSHVFDQISEIYPLSPKKEKHRRFVSDLLHSLSYASQSKENVKTSPRYLPLVVFFQESKYKEISSLYSSISELRNDINHAGMREKVSSADSLSKKIRTKIQETEALIITLTK